VINNKIFAQGRWRMLGVGRPTVLIKRYYAHGRPSRGVHGARASAAAT